MLGLSITAIGLRPIEQCFNIFEQLRNPLNLDFIELAVGSPCHGDCEFSKIPIVLHDSCLYNSEGRKRLNLLCPKTWRIYERFAAEHEAIALSIHPPLKRMCTQQDLEIAVKHLESALKIPVYVEIMPSSEYWCSSWDTLIDHSLLLDVSHVLIWYRGNQDLTQKSCSEILRSFDIGAIHLSHNSGYSDDHDLIPEKIWFRDLVSIWRQQYLVTFESLPNQYSAYERLDKKIKKARKPRSI